MPRFVDGDRRHQIPTLPHPNKVLFPEKSITRRDLAHYYAQVAPLLIGQAKNRPVTVKRWPNGIYGTMFYQKHDPPGSSTWITLASDEEVIRWVGQGVIEWHAPLGQFPRLDIHDWAVMDLDPHPPAGWPEVVFVARAFGNLLDLLGLPYLMKTSGQEGLHFYLAIVPTAQDAVVRAMAALARIMEKSFPEWVTTARLTKDRGARVYLDYQQNGHRRTMALAYTVRAVPAASVSTPVGLDEVAVNPTSWTIAAVLERLQKVGDLFTWSGPRVDLLDILTRRGILSC